MDDESTFSDLFEDSEFQETNLAGAAASPDGDIFSILEALERVSDFNPMTPKDNNGKRLVSQKSTSSISALQESENELEASPASKRPKLDATASSEKVNNQDGSQKMSHITVERNRRKQMNEHFSVLRSLMPCFYVKRGDQASIIVGVVHYINELQQLLQSLEAKKQRKVVCSEVLTTRLAVSSLRPSPLSPRKTAIKSQNELTYKPENTTTKQPLQAQIAASWLPFTTCC